MLAPTVLAPPPARDGDFSVDVHHIGFRNVVVTAMVVKAKKKSEIASIPGPNPGKIVSKALCT